MQYEQSRENQPSDGSYSENFTRLKRGLLVFLLDQSGSMIEHIILQGYELTLAQMASSILNSILVTVIDNAALDTSTGRRKNYCDIIIFGYGDNVKPLLNLAGVPVPLPDLAENTRGKQSVRKTKYDSIKGNYVTVDEEQPYWIEPLANSSWTEMALAVSRAHQVVQDWLRADPRRRASFPPIVINITDGRHNGKTKGDDPVQEARKLRQLRTDDGAVLLFNCHITKSNTQALSFPSSSTQIKSLNLLQQEQEGAQQLFDMSSEVPATMAKRAQQLSGTTLSPGARGFIYNASGEDLIRFLSWGTLVNTEHYR
jgi:hypothetical protein